MISRLLAILAVIVVQITGAAADDGLAARWTFDEGSGTITADSAGTSNGTIKGAKWISCGKGFALSFDGIGDFVDCGDTPALDLRGPMTLEAWVKPDAPPQREPGILGKSFSSYLLTYYQSGSSYFYINEGGNGAQGPIKVGAWSHIAATFDGKTIRFFVNGAERGSRDSKFDRIGKGGRFLMGVVPADTGASDEALRSTEHFQGALDDVRIYSVARSGRQIADSFNEGAIEKGLQPIVASQLAELLVEVFPYPEQKKCVIAASFPRMEGLGDAIDIRCELQRENGEVIASQQLQVKSPVREAEFTFDSDKLGNGNLVSLLTVTSGSIRKEEKKRFALSAAGTELPSPDQRKADQLVPAILPPQYEVQVTPEGVMLVHLADRIFPIESRFSHPGGGDNAFAVQQGTTAEKSFKPAVRQLDEHTWQVSATGEFYQITRRIRQTATKIDVSDTITNLTHDVLGVIYSNGIDTRKLADVHLSIMPNPTVFAASGKWGLGLVALDDVYQIHQQTSAEDGIAKIRDEHFGVAAAKSYTIEWALYPTASDNYFDFINQVRRDEGLNGHVDGSVELTSRWGAPPADQVASKGLRYVSSCYLTHSLQNPHRSLEGWEFVEFPELCDRIAAAIADTRSKFPDIKPMFHVAHSLYFTNKPVEKFGDSVVRDEKGNLDFYGPNTIEYYGKYVAPELFNENWRWYLIYPTSGNSFGKYTLAAVDVMIRQLKAGAIWADGFFTAYVKGGYTYDTWDGHSVTIDLKTKRVTRKKASPTLLGRDVLLEIVRQFERSGGVLISNDKPGPRSFWREKMITSNETGGGDQQPIAGLYLGQTVTPLGNPGAFNSPRSLHRDILAKLDAGALYFFYGEGGLVREKSIVACMYPITFASIQPGIVQGTERIVTNRSGAFGWTGNNQLHAIDLADARGSLRPNPFFTTVEGDSVRSQVTLQPEEIAVVRKIPATLNCSEPLNCRVTRYDSTGVWVLVSCTKPGKLILKSGDFVLRYGINYSVQIGDRHKTVVASAETLTVEIPANQHLEVSVRATTQSP